MPALTDRDAAKIVRTPIEDLGKREPRIAEAMEEDRDGCTALTAIDVLELATARERDAPDLEGLLGHGGRFRFDLESGEVHGHARERRRRARFHQRNARRHPLE